MTSAWALYLRSVLSSSGRTRTGSPVADRKSTRLNSSHLVISYAVLFFKKKTRLNSSHLVISYAVFCLKKKIFKIIYIAVAAPLSMYFVKDMQSKPDDVTMTNHMCTTLR